MKPFYLNSVIFLNKQKLNFLVDELVFSLLSLKPDLIGNLNGDLKLSLTNIEHELIRNGFIRFNISDKSIIFNKVEFNLSDIGIIESKINYEEKNGEIIFNSSNILRVNNNRKFAKKFQLNPNIVKDLHTIYFKIKKNINTGLISIFDININKLDNNYKSEEEVLYNIKNTQELKSLVKKILNN